MKTAKLVVYAIKQFQFIFIFTVDEFEALCGDRNKGYKTVETLTGPRVQGLYQVDDTRIQYMIGWRAGNMELAPCSYWPREQTRKPVLFTWNCTLFPLKILSFSY